MWSILTKCWQIITSWRSLAERLLPAQKSYIQLSLPTMGDLYQHHLQLRQIALLEATRIRPSQPLYRDEDQALVEEFRQLEEIDPLQYNSERMYEDLLAERELAEVLQAQATMDVWWGIATAREKEQWLEKARELNENAKRWNDH